MAFRSSTCRSARLRLRHSRTATTVETTDDAPVVTVAMRQPGEIIAALGVRTATGAARPECWWLLLATVTDWRNAGACSACASVQKSATHSQLAAAESCIVANASFSKMA